MTEQKQPQLRQACYGIGCPEHSTCARYAAVNGAGSEVKFMGTCSEQRKDRPGYVSMDTKCNVQSVIAA